MNEQNPDRTLPPRESTQTQRFQPVVEDADRTNPDIRIPETEVVDRGYENPLEELLSIDENIAALQNKVELLNKFIADKVPEYGGMKVLNPRFNLDLELIGVDENGVQFKVPKDLVKHFLESVT